MKLILASQSPQRKEILTNLGISFKAIPSHINESHDGLTRPHAIAKLLAYKKAYEVACAYPDDWVLGSDTLVVLANGTITGKPKNKEEAKKVLKSYQNSYCDVYSGLALINLTAKPILSSSQKSIDLIGYEKTRIHFKDFSNKELEEYLNSGKWKNRSGAMTLEDAGDWVKKIKGDYWNVIGLPVNLLKRYLSII